MFEKLGFKIYILSLRPNQYWRLMPLYPKSDLHYYMVLVGLSVINTFEFNMHVISLSDLDALCRHTNSVLLVDYMTLDKSGRF